MWLRGVGFERWRLRTLNLSGGYKLMLCEQSILYVQMWRRKISLIKQPLLGMTQFQIQSHTFSVTCIIGMGYGLFLLFLAAFLFDKLAGPAMNHEGINQM